MTSDLGLRSELIEATPGDAAVVVVDVLNHLPTPAAFQVRVVGAAAEWAGEARLTDVLQPGARTAIEITVVLPLGFPTGQHLLGVESVPLNADGTPSTDQQLRRVADLTVSVGSLTGLHAVLEPTNVTGREGFQFSRLNPRAYRRGYRPRRARRGQTQIRLRNRSFEPIPVTLSATSPGDEVAVSFDQTELVIPPGQTMGVRAKVRADRPIWGRMKRRPFTVIAKSTGHQLYLEGSHSQAARIRPGALRGLGILTVLAVWASTLALVYDRVTQDESNDDVVAEAVSADGADDGSGTGSGSSGDGSGSAGGADGEAAQGEVRDLSISAAAVEASGQVKAREPEGVRVRIRSVSLVDEISPDATLVSAPRGVANRGVKLFGRRGGMIHDRIVPAEVSTTTDDEGRWAVAGLSGPGFFEIRFTKPGYATRAYVVEMPEDGTPISLDTDLEAGDGLVSGVILGPDGPLGDVDITITDGTVTYSTTTPTTGAVGSWSVEGLATPGTYLVTARRRGFATATELVRLSGGQSLTGVNIGMADGTGTILGSIRSTRGPLGDVTITATDGDLVRTTTSLTENPVGTFSLPELPRPGIYTLTVSAEGWLTQTMEVDLRDDEKQVNLNMVPRTGVAYGRVTDQNTRLPLGGVGITAVSEDFTYKSTTNPDGRFEMVGLEPGSYVLEFHSFEYHVGSSLITLGSGALREVNLSLAPRDTLEPPPNNSLTISFAEPGNLTVTERTTGQTRVSDGTASVSFENLPAGVRTFDISGVGFQPATIQFRMGLNGPFSTSVTLKHLVVVDLEVRARVGGAPLAGAHVVIRRDAAACLPSNVGTGCQPFEGVTDNNGDALDTAGKPPELTDGDWIAHVELVGYDLGDIKFSTNYDASPTTTVELLIDRLGEIRLNVVEPVLNPGGQVAFRPVDGAQLALTGETINGDPLSIPFTDTDDPYIIDSIPPGTYWIDLSGTGYRTTRYPLASDGPISVALNDRVERSAVIAPESGGTTGRVVWMRNGVAEPIADAQVHIEGVANYTGTQPPSAIQGSWLTFTDADGRFSFSGSEGPIFDWADVTVTYPGGAFAANAFQTGTFDVMSNENVGDLKVEAEPGNLRLTAVLDFGEAPIPEVVRSDRIRVEIVQAPTAALIGTTLTPAGTVSGTAVFQRSLPAGDYDLHIWYEPVDANDIDRYTPVILEDVFVSPLGSAEAGPASLVAKGRISGIVSSVRDPDKDTSIPAPGAQVILLDTNGDPVKVPPGESFTNPQTVGPDGGFSFNAIDAGTYRLHVNLDGYTTDRLENPGDITIVGGQRSDDIELNLRKLGSFQGVLLGDNRAGAITPISGSTVKLTDSSGEVQYQTTDPDGLFTFPNLDRGDYTIDVDPPGFEAHTHDFTLDWGQDAGINTPVSITTIILPAGLRFRVESTSGSSGPIKDLTVSLTRDGQSIDIPTPDGDGYYHFQNLAPGVYELDLNARNHAPVNRKFNLTAGQTTYLENESGDPVLLPATLSTVMGQVELTINGQPVADRAGILVEVIDGDDNVIDNGNEPAKMYTLENGEFAFSELVDGTYRVRASKAGYEASNETPWAISAQFTAADAVEVEVFDLTLRAINHTMVVKVTSAVGGEIIAGAPVRLEARTGQAVDMGPVTTLADGTATFSGVVPGRYDIIVDPSTTGHLGGSKTNVQVHVRPTPPEQQEIVIRESRITGTVELMGGGTDSVDGSYVEVLRNGNPVASISPIRVDSTGAFTFYVDPASGYSVRAEGPNNTYIPESQTLPPLGNGQSTAPFTVSVQKAADVTVVVRDGRGELINGAEITYEDPDTQQAVTVRDGAGSDLTDGRIPLRLRPGSYTFILTAGIDYSGATSSTTLGSGANDEVLLTTVATASLTISITGGDGTGWMATITPGTDGGASTVQNIAEGATSVTIPNVHTGTYQVVVCQPAPGACDRSNTAPSVAVQRGAANNVSLLIPAPDPDGDDDDGR